MRRPAWVLRRLIFTSAGLLVTQSDGRGEQAPRSLSAADQTSLERVVAEVRQAILSEDVDALLGHVSQREPLVCTDTAFSYKDVQRFLRDKDSTLYMSLFDSARFVASCGKEYSADSLLVCDRDFLATANPGLTISALGKGWATVAITSPKHDRFPFQWDFHKEHGRWKLAGRSFIIGRCSCG